MVVARPASFHQVAGRVTDYQEHNDNDQILQTLFLDGDPYNVSSEDSYTPPVDSYPAMIGKPVRLYVNEGTNDVIALSDPEERFHAGEDYLQPRSQYYLELSLGGIVTAGSIAALLVVGVATLRSRRPT